MPSFDIVSKVDMQEIDNVVNSTIRELSNRYDFKSSKFSLNIDEKENLITIIAEDDYKLSQIIESLKSNCTKRKIDSKSLDIGKKEDGSHGSMRQVVNIIQGISKELAKKIVKEVKNKKMKIQASIKEDEVRVEGKKIDDLQFIMSEIKDKNKEQALQFINFRN